MPKDLKSYLKGIILFLTFFFVFALIFIPAGTLYWTEAWIYFLIIACYFIPTVIYLAKNNPELIKRRTSLKLIIPEKSWDMVILLLANGFIFSLFAITGLDAVRFGWSAVSFELKAFGFVGIIISFVILFLIMRENTFLFRIVKVQKGQSVVTTGPYSIVRHPMYLAIIFQLFCTPLALGSLYALIPALLADIMIVIRTSLEDKTLHEELQGYNEYAKKTRYRLFPGIW